MGHEALRAWVEGGDLVAAVGGPAGACATVARALLVAGSKSFTHTVIALERYQPLLEHLLQEAGGEVCTLTSLVVLDWSRIRVQADEVCSLKLHCCNCCVVEVCTLKSHS